jgi:hypothetical protein
VDALLRRLLRAAVRRGLAGDWTWLVIAACAFVLRRSLADKGGVVSTLRVSPGEQILISVRAYNDPPPASDVPAPAAAAAALQSINAPVNED